MEAILPRPLILSQLDKQSIRESFQNVSNHFKIAATASLRARGPTVPRWDLEAIANLAQRRARAKIPEIQKALQGHRMRDHHRQLIRFSLNHLVFLEQQIADIDSEVQRLIEQAGYKEQLELLQTIPGVQQMALVQIRSPTRLDRVRFSIEGDSGYAARAACQISGILAVRPPSLPILT